MKNLEEILEKNNSIKVFVCYKVIEHSNRNVTLQAGLQFLKKYNAEKYISNKSGEWLILTKYAKNKVNL